MYLGVPSLRMQFVMECKAEYFSIMERSCGVMKTILEVQRQTDVLHEAEVIVVGGGPAEI